MPLNKVREHRFVEIDAREPEFARIPALIQRTNRQKYQLMFATLSDPYTTVMWSRAKDVKIARVSQK